MASRNRVNGAIAEEKPSRRPPTLGQHFLADRGTAEEIVSALGAVASETVVEIGPGKGVLT
ncbi:MAG TPA: rRNA adenine N-6-methyltransferase family protein, partial [Terriglobales bacterium]